jgi:hypothetical protein
VNNQIKPSKSIWDYYKRGCNNGFGITVDLVISSIADVMYGYGISYSATELLLDLGYLRRTGSKKSITKAGKMILSHELHERYHRGLKQFHVIVNPHEENNE